ncbi:aldose 1-epimerase family protein [Novosphingobium sp. KCTC 2891]|uniref:aldose 1-epimerase family protein n=1 Tax=Novosphingobium sp. KCTC 2891 TaxID=2989730 RepID=UPI0022222688|nr:aldose 1-epimerase family protein [Novosphingobium sp. KCTC 2891]MCW1383062.1 aldose 1-epimerase family protein [Novosphingobium sp. KCTC 2891]
MTDLLTISSGDLSARINPLGAELWSLTDAQGREYMTDADPAFWGGHAPLLFPIVGSLAQDRLRLDGADYALPRHGFARRSTFALAGQGEDHLRFRLTDSPDTRAVYPFAFVLEMAFRLEGMTLAMEASVTNPGQADLPFSFGYHPAFAWPLPGNPDKAAHKLVFEKAEPQDVRRLGKADGLLLPGGEATPVTGRELALTEDLFRADAMVWTDLASRRLSYGADGGAWLDVAFPDTAMFGLWQVPGGRYICLEPWAGHADPVGFDGDFREKPGAVLLPPGETARFRMAVSVRPS